MINHIDLSSVLRGAVCDLYSNLVTRPTGAAVRGVIEQRLADMGDRTLTVIDFSHVGLLDFSCADEVVAKLLLRYCAEAPPHDGYFLFRGVREDHYDAIEAVLERHGLAIVAQGEEGVPHLVGTVSDGERAAWEACCRLGAVDAGELAQAAGMPAGDAERVLDGLRRRRLVMRVENVYVPVGVAR